MMIEIPKSELAPYTFLCCIEQGIPSMGFTSNYIHISVNLSRNLESEFIQFLCYLANLVRFYWNLTDNYLIYSGYTQLYFLSILLYLSPSQLTLFLFCLFFCCHRGFPHVHDFLYFQYITYQSPLFQSLSLQYINQAFQIEMSSKIQTKKLTLQNLSQELKRWKTPYLQQVKQTTNQMHEKASMHRKKLLENTNNENENYTPYFQDECNGHNPNQDSNSTNKQLTNQDVTPDSGRGLRHQNFKNQKKNNNFKQNLHRHNSNKAMKTQEEQQRNSNIHVQLKLQQWKPNQQYGFTDYQELVKNYSEVFSRKQKVKKNKKDEIVEDFRADQWQMVSEIYNDLKNTKDSTVSFESIEAFFENYELFYYFYNIHPYRLLNLLKQSARKYQNRLTKQQFFDFFLIDRPIISQIKQTTQKHINSTSILSEEVWEKLKNIFDTLDTFGNQRICIRTFFQRVKSHPSSISILSSEAVSFSQIGRTYTLQKVLFDLENKKVFDKKVQWGTIFQMIYNFTHILEPTIDQIYRNNIQKAKITKQSNYFLLEPKAIEIIKQIFNRCPKYCGCFVKTSFFSVQLQQTGLLKPYLNSATRIQNLNSYVNLQETIKRLTKQAPKYIDMDEMLDFMSIKGYQDIKKFNQLYNKIQASSDEEQTKQQKQQRRLKKIRSFQNLRKNFKRKEKKKPVYQVTKIKQFNLHKRDHPTIREQKVQQMIKQKQMQDEIQLNKKFKAKSIPVSLNPERYQKYVKCLQQKKQSILNNLGLRRQKDQALIQYLSTNTKLFEQKRSKPHCEQLKQNYVFEPTPLPIHISQELLPRIQAQKQQRRKQILEENLRKYHQQYWKNLRNITTSDKDDSLLQKINLIEEKKNFEQFKAKKVPNFEELHQKFLEQLQKKKQQFTPTQVQQFKLSSPSHKDKKTQYMSPKSNQFRSVSPYSPQVDIKSTKKYNDMVVHNQTKMAERQLQQLKKQKQQQERQLRQRNFAKMMRKNLIKCTSNAEILRKKSQQKIKNFQNYILRLENQTEQQLASIYQRVLQRPFLFQQASATRKPISKQKPKRVSNYKGSPEQAQNYPFKQGIFEKEGQQFHPIQSQNLNQSF